MIPQLPPNYVTPSDGEQIQSNWLHHNWKWAESSSWQLTPLRVFKRKRELYELQGYVFAKPDPNHIESASEFPTCPNCEALAREVEGLKSILNKMRAEPCTIHCSESCQMGCTEPTQGVWSSEPPCVEGKK